MKVKGWVVTVIVWIMRLYNKHWKCVHAYEDCFECRYFENRNSAQFEDLYTKPCTITIHEMRQENSK